MKVKITDIHEGDAWYSDRKELIGKIINANPTKSILYDGWYRTDAFDGEYKFNGFKYEPVEELKPCWKCGGQPFFVNENGYKDLRINPIGEFVSCNRECMPISEKYTVDEWQNHPRHEPVEEPSMSELGYSIEYPKGTMNQDGTVTLKKETINGFKKWVNEKFNKKKSIIQKIRDYDKDIDLLERQVTMFDELADTNKKAYDMACKKNNELCARVESAEAMRDHYKTVSETWQSTTISKSRDLELMTKVADNWQKKLICVNKDYADATEMIGRRLNFSVGTYQITIIIGNPVTACYFTYPNLVEDYDETFLAVSVCHKNDTFNWKRGAIQSLENMIKYWLGSAYGDPFYYYNALFTAYPELGIQPVEPKKPVKKAKKK